MAREFLHSSRLILFALVLLGSSLFFPLPSKSVAQPYGGGHNFHNPGQHTMVLAVSRRRTAYQIRTFETPFRNCTFLDQHLLLEMVGWGQIEPCFAYVSELAVNFNFSPLNAIPNKTINRVILRFDEKGSTVRQRGIVPGWSDGRGRAQHKPDGCVAVRVPARNWITGQVPRGRLEAQNRGASVRPLAARLWDVTQAIRWQVVPNSVPLLPPGGNAQGAGYGLLLTGAPGIDSLRARDSTNCMSVISNITLEVTFTVPRPGLPFREPR